MATSSFDATLLAKIASLTEISAKDPHSTVFVPLSDAYRSVGLLDDALEVAEKGVKAQPRYIPGYLILGRILFERGNLSAAVAAFESAHAIDNKDLSAIKGLARVLSRQGNFVRARQLLEEGAIRDPNDSTIGKMLATLFPQSMPAPTVVSPQLEKEPISTSTIAEIYLQQGFPERALKVYVDLLAKHPGNAELLRKVGEVSNLVQKVASGAANEDIPESSKSDAKIVDPAHYEPDSNSLSQQFPVMAGPSIARRQIETLSRLLAAIFVRRQQHVLQ